MTCDYLIKCALNFVPDNDHEKNIIDSPIFNWYPSIRMIDDFYFKYLIVKRILKIIERSLILFSYYYCTYFHIIRQYLLYNSTFLVEFLLMILLTLFSYFPHEMENRGKNNAWWGNRKKKIAGATRTLPKARAPCVIVSLSPFPYLPRPIARLYLIKRSAHDRELLPRFATPDKTLALGRDNKAGEEKNACSRCYALRVTKW